MAYVNPYFNYQASGFEDMNSDDDEDTMLESEDFATNNDTDPIENRRKIVRSIPLYVQYREMGHSKRVRRDPLMGFSRMVKHKLITERLYDIEPLDKIFCSQWLNSSTVVFGTKCNRLRMLNTERGSLLDLEVLESSLNTHIPHYDDLCGIHAIEINPSGSLMVTGARNPNDTAVYSLPDVSPVCVGEAAHNDWIFDIKWLDDTHYVSGGRDCKLAIWEVNERRALQGSDYVRGLRDERNSYYHMVAKSELSTGEDRVRALNFSPQNEALLALTLSANLQLWDTKTMTLLKTGNLSFDKENVCIASNDRRAAIGSKSEITIVEASTLKNIRYVRAPKHDCGIRSLSFNDNIITVGTGQSSVIFLDIRTFKYLPSESMPAPGDIACLKCSPGWMAPYNGVFAEGFNPAVYTHCYDPSGLKLFAAGGPLPASMRGAYAALWH